VKSGNKLTITEIFQSIQGEGHYSGYPCGFIRLTGCNLLCKWCDTKYAYDDGSIMDVEDIINEVNSLNTDLVEITGGEPLLQDNIYLLFEALQQQKKRVLLETNGSILIDRIPKYVHIIMDIKTPSSDGYSDTFIKNLAYLKKTDEIKIVIASFEDFEWILDTAVLYNLFEIVDKPVILQPAFGILPEQELAAWILDSGKPFKLGVQLHKYIFGEFARGV